MTGALLSCDVHAEREAIREAYALFEDLAPEKPCQNAAASTSFNDGTAGEGLARELALLKGEGSAERAKSLRRFGVAQTGCGGNVMIRFEDASIDATELVERLMDNALASQECRAPHIVRMIPIQQTCGATTATILAALQPLLKPLAGYDGTYAVQWRRRCNDQINKMEVINAVAGAMVEVAPKATVDLVGAEVAILVEVIRKVALVSVLQKWQRFQQYNYRVVAGFTPPQTAPKPKAQGGDAD